MSDEQTLVRRLREAAYEDMLHEESADRIEKLEAALQAIVEQERQTAHPVVVHIIAIARKALEQTNG
jgi:hypothetical protein